MTEKPARTTSNEHNLPASGDRFRALVTATSDVIYRMNHDWTVMYAMDGRGFLQDTEGQSVDWLAEYIHPLDQEKVRTAIAEAIAQKKIFELEHRVLQADGSVGWTHSRTVPILNEKGEIIEWFGAASDITARKQAEEALAEEKERTEQLRRTYEVITAGTPDLMYVFDLDYRFTYANRALLEMWGKTWETSIGRNLLENGYEPWHAEMHEREIDKIRETRESIRGEVSFPHATLGRRVYDYILTPVVNDQGEVEAVAGTTRDVTDRKNWEQELADKSEQMQAINEEMAAMNEEMVAINEEQSASNEELATTNDELARVNEKLLQASKEIKRADESLRMAIEAAALGTFNINAEDRIFMVSSKLKEFFGVLPDEELTFETAMDLIHEDCRQQVVDSVEKAFKKHTPFDMEFPIIGRIDGKQRWVRGIGEMQHSDGKDYFAGVLHEITEKKQDEIRKNDFIGMVSHELKTPLTSMKGYIQMITHKLKDHGDAFILGALDKANAQIAKMTGMINGFLNVSRLEAGKIHLDPQLFDLSLLIKDIEDECRSTILSHELIFEQVSQTFVSADRDKIGQVMHNLISNAVKYSPSGTIVKIECNQTNGMAQFTVTDRGMGIKPDDLERIFDRFYRVEGNHMFSISGFGIGLYLCSEIVRRHQGEIWAKSEFGNGSAFSFSLPLAEM